MTGLGCWINIRSHFSLLHEKSCSVVIEPWTQVQNDGFANGKEKTIRETLENMTLVQISMSLGGLPAETRMDDTV
ncbi:hypothetical protein OPV22_023058 [Ensete ventricosum]|uniref:Uncharacterized protein n=1 Tax=Ensete ventricosum TaxID=4639 RepID=A0AAV8PCC9_ENSVE|nr:hypothetical protein OPV22_023058 [Ensete ventricosum]